VKIASIALLSVILVGIAPAQPTSERVWTGVNGKSFSGAFHRLSPDKKKVDFLSKDGKLVTVALENLIPEDRELILNPTKVTSAVPVATGDLSQFKPVATPNRMLIPSLDPKALGCPTDKALIDALWISLLWWDQTGVLAVPKKGDLESKAQWLHKKLTRSVGAGGDYIGVEDAKKGVEKYFSEELEKVGACRITVETKDFSAVRLGGFLEGSNAVVLEMSMLYVNGNGYTVSSALESMSEDGKFAVHIFGRRFTGRLKPMEKEKQQPGEAVGFEYVLDRPGDLPDFYITNGARFFMGKEPWNAAIVLKPYVYLEPGKPVPLPAEEERPIPAEQTTKTIERKAPEVKFPVSFVSKVYGRREWVLRNGISISGTPVARRDDQMVVLKKADGQQLTVNEGELSDEDRARFCFWEASSGMPLSIPKLDLTYRLNTSQSGSFEVKVSAEGSLGRVCFTDESSTSVLVYDMNDGAFVSTLIHQGRAKETTRIHQGRFLPENLLPRKISSRFTQADVSLFLSGILPRAPELISAVVPCRRVRFPLSKGPTFLKPDIDFVLCEQPTVTAGLFQLLFSMTAGGIFAPQQIPSNRDGESVLATLAACQVLPLRIAWENPVDATIESEYHRVRNAGRFSIELTRAVVPDRFPDGHFAIPAAVRAMTAGDTQITETEKPR
jgi:hypothetical protein